MDTRVISVGGSIIVPESRPDDALIAKFVRMSASWLNVHDNRRLVLVVGGGATARNYQKAYIDAFSRRGMLVDAIAKNSTITQSAAADMIPRFCVMPELPKRSFPRSSALAMLSDRSLKRQLQPWA